MDTTENNKKKCSNCKELRLLKDFWMCSTTKDGRAYQCKYCKRSQFKAWEKMHPEHAKKIWRLGATKSALRKKYGISLAVYNELLEKQKGCCAICGKRSVKRRLAVEHNHTTGAIRGLVCAICNRAIALIEEDRSRSQKILDHLDKNLFDATQLLLPYRE